MAQPLNEVRFHFASIDMSVRRSFDGSARSVKGEALQSLKAYLAGRCGGLRPPRNLSSPLRAAVANGQGRQADSEPFPKQPRRGGDDSQGVRYEGQG